VWKLVTFWEHSEETYAVVVDHLRDDGNLAGEGARFEEDNCSTESVIVSKKSIVTTTYLAQPQRSAPKPKTTSVQHYPIHPLHRFFPVLSGQGRLEKGPWQKNGTVPIMKVGEEGRER
jgi:hypothetical protein